MRTYISLDHINSRLRAFAHCNLHGTWEGDADIEMAD